MSTKLEQKYPKVQAKLRAKHTKHGALTVKEAKEMIGWKEEPMNDDWEKDFFLKDTFGRKIRLLNNTANRPFKLPLAERYSNEHLRGKWSLNLETIVLSDCGEVLQGQHRLVGFILAEQVRQLDPDKWGTNPIEFETLLGFGVVNKPENSNTYDLGAKRSLGDVIYRQQDFKKGLSDKEQKKISTVLAGAIRLVWLRAGGQQVSFAPHFPHSEAIEFYGTHPKILKAVTEIVELDEGEEGNEKCISSLLSLGYAAAILYLQSIATDFEKAIRFWIKFASGEGLSKGSPILSLRKSLIKIDASSGGKRDQIIGMTIKTWLLFNAGKDGTTKEIKVARKKDGDRFILSEFPRIGGLDSPVDAPTELTLQQLRILQALRKTKKETKFDELSKETGLPTGQISKATTSENGQSLVSRGLVTVEQYELQDGETGKPPYYVDLTKEGKAFAK